MWRKRNDGMERENDDTIQYYPYFMYALILFNQNRIPFCSSSHNLNEFRKWARFVRCAVNGKTNENIPFR